MGVHCSKHSWLRGELKASLGHIRVVSRKRIKENWPKVTKVFSDKADCASSPRLSTTNCCKLCLPIYTSNARTFVSCCTVTVCHACHNKSRAERHQLRDKTTYLPGIKNGFQSRLKLVHIFHPSYIFQKEALFLHLAPSAWAPFLGCGPSCFVPPRLLDPAASSAKIKVCLYTPHATPHRAHRNCLLINQLKSAH